MFLAAMTAVAVALAPAPTPSEGTVVRSLLPCSFDEVREGMVNWLDHRENAEWCSHPVVEQFQQRCLMKFWGYKLD